MYWVITALLAAAPFKAASAGLTVSGMPAERVEFYSEYVAQQMATTGLSVITPKQIATLLGMERQKQLLGCSDQATSCIAELAGALGVDGVVQGEAAKLESGGFQVSLKVLWSRDGRVLTSFIGRAPEEGSLLDAMGKGAALMAKDLTQGDWVRLTVTPTSHSVVPSSPVRLVGLAALGVGAVALGGAVFCLVRSGAIANQLKTQTFVSLGEAQAVAREGGGLQTLGVVLVGAGAVSLVAGGLLALLGGPLGDLRPTGWLTPTGAGLGFAGGLW